MSIPLTELNVYHLIRLEEVFKRLKENGLKVKRSKCAFFQDSVQYLGHKIDRNGLHVLDDKIVAIENMPAPQNITQLKSFLDLYLGHH